MIVSPITNTNRNYPLHIPLDERTTTTGVIMCDQIRTLDLNSRHYIFVEKVPADILKKVIDVVYAEIECESASILFANVYSIDGKLLVDKNLGQSQTGLNRIRIGEMFQSLSNGNYLLVIQTADKSFVAKVIKP